MANLIPTAPDTCQEWEEAADIPTLGEKPRLRDCGACSSVPTLPTPPSQGAKEQRPADTSQLWVPRGLPVPREQVPSRVDYLAPHPSGRSSLLRKVGNA